MGEVGKRARQAVCRKKNHASCWRLAEKSPMANRIKILVVDDSKLIRQAVRRIFETDGQLQVAAEAAHGQQALDLIPRVDPDVITLDVHMPVMDGISTLKRIMLQHPKPTVMLSNLTMEGATVTFDTLKFGAVDVIAKPSNLAELDAARQMQEINQRVKLASQVQIESIRYLRTRPNGHSVPAGNGSSCRYLVAVGAAEGGYGALLKIIPQLSAGLPAAFLVMLYADAPYVEAFVSYLDLCSPMSIRRAVHGDPIEAGTCYIACGREYLTVQGSRKKPRLVVNPAPFETRKGSIDMLMFSVAELFTERALGIVLTGSGRDGVEGVGELIRCGGQALVQEPGSCLHKQMAQEVLSLQPVDHSIPDAEMAAAVSAMFQ